MPTPPPLQHQAVNATALTDTPAGCEQRGSGERHAGQAEFDRQQAIVGGVFEQERNAEEQHDNADPYDGVATEQPIACDLEQAIDDVGRLRRHGRPCFDFLRRADRCHACNGRCLSRLRQRCGFTHVRR